MGVAGCGKSSVAVTLAARLGARFLDGDDLHPPGNIAKMAAGTALTDADRWPWLTAVGQALGAGPGSVVGACSALRRAYREHITAAAGQPVLFVYLDGSRELIGARMAAREGHFMPPSLLDSQFATLERPSADENAILVPIDGTVDQSVASILDALSAHS